MNISELCYAELLDYADKQEKETNGMEFISNEQVIREYHRWWLELNKRKSKANMKEWAALQLATL